MTDYTTNLKTWGDTGQEYPSGYSYADGEPPVDEWDDYFNYNVEQDLQHLISLTNERLDSESGSSYPSSPTPGHAVWRTDNRRLAVYDDTSAAWREIAYKTEFDAHNHDARYIMESGDTMDGTLTLSDGSTAASRSWVDSNADVPNADYADNAGSLNGDTQGSGNGIDADMIDGEHASAFADAGHVHALGDLSDVTASGEGSGNGFDADTVDGREAADVESDAVESAVIWNPGYAPGFGG